MADAVPVGVAPWTSEVACGPSASNGIEAAFRENEIDDAILPRLTADDLKDLGVGIVGHRRKLLEAIAALHTEADAKPPSAQVFSPIESATSDIAERRQVTVDTVPGAPALTSPGTRPQPSFATKPSW